METVIDKVLKKIEDVRAIALRAISRISQAEGEISIVKDKMSCETGDATINTAYAGTSGSRRVSWNRYGNVVVVWFYDIQQTASVTSSINCVLASGLPKAKYRSIATLVRHENSAACRIGILEGSTDVVFWWTSVGTKAAMSGQLVYIAE